VNIPQRKSSVFHPVWRGQTGGKTDFVHHEGTIHTKSSLKRLPAASAHCIGFVMFVPSWWTKAVSHPVAGGNLASAVQPARSPDCPGVRGVGNFDARSARNCRTTRNPRSFTRNCTL